MPFNFEQLVSHIAGRVAQGMRPDDPVTKRYLGSLAKLAEHALTKWSAASGAGIRCGIKQRRRKTGRVERCGQLAAGSCVVCARATCIDHAMVSIKDGSIICDGCVVGVKSAYAGGGPPPPAQRVDQAAMRLKHLQTLGLDDGATAAEIKAAHRRLAKKCHPDGKTGRARERAEKRMKAINEAFSWLTQHDQAAA